MLSKVQVIFNLKLGIQGTKFVSLLFWLPMVLRDLNNQHNPVVDKTNPYDSQALLSAQLKAS